MKTIYVTCRPYPVNRKLFKEHESRLKHKFLFSGFGGPGKIGTLKLNITDDQIHVVDEIQAELNSWRPVLEWDLKVI